MYCEKCGRKLKPGERCSCEKENIDRSAQSQHRGKQKRSENFLGRQERKKAAKIFTYLSVYCFCCLAGRYSGIFKWEQIIFLNKFQSHLWQNTKNIFRMVF